ncbi:hypothetical protein BKA62DRAFT_715493 [Auriculariales sp. MPI-PUGE-AT-0066]|nr:hypothetical protein BKA62DRAFT_715493 [Auriculariales sp. MPI-PUGE-AT-0066]
MPSNSWAFIIEIVLGIIEHSYFTAGARPDYTALKTWCLVSKTISFESQRLLFRDVRLTSYTDSAAFLSATASNTQRGKQLGAYVCRITVPFAGSITETRFSRVLRHCVNLYELQVIYSGQELEQLQSGTVAALEAVAGSVRALDVTTANEPFLVNGTTDALMLQLLAHLPQVEFLGLNGRCALTRSPFTPQPPALYELAWNTYDPALESNSRRLLAHIEWLLQNSLDTIRVLRFRERGIVPSNVFQPIARKYGTHIHSLTIESRVDKNVQHLHLFPELRELVLGWIDRETLLAVHNAWVTSKARIRHLALRGISWEHMGPLQSLIEEATDLKCITFYRLDANLTQLRALCKKHKITLQTCEPFPPRVLPLRAPDYPRAAHPDDFLIMQKR